MANLLPEVVTLPPTPLPRFQARGPRERWAEAGVALLAEGGVSDEAIHKAYVELLGNEGRLFARQWNWLVGYLVRYSKEIGPLPVTDEEIAEKMVRVCPACGLLSSVKVTGRCERCAFSTSV